MLTPHSSISKLKGIGEKRAVLLRQKGLRTVEDLLLYLPRKYEERGKIKPLNQAEGEAEVFVEVLKRRWWRRGKRWFLEAEIRDSSGKGKALWFNQKRLLKVIYPGKKYYLRGKVEVKGGERIILSPEVKTGVPSGIFPIYERIYRISSGLIRRLVLQALSQTEIEENLPEAFREKYSLPGRRESLLYLHSPPPDAPIHELNSGETPYHHRLIYEEAFFYQLKVKFLREKTSKPKGRSYPLGKETVNSAFSLFPFTFTPSQRRALEEILRDLSSPTPMRRLLHGEVGSGKTAVAVASAALVCKGGYQVAFMAPTELLAHQHYRRLKGPLEKIGISSALLISGMGQRERRQALEDISSGRAKMVFGTHALFYQGVEFSNLAYAIVDEQHRFGVAQRARLYSKGENPDVLLLSATPIPRTLALVLYSDLEISTLRDMPKPRNVKTEVMKMRQFRSIVPFLKELMRKGEQGFAIFPVIEKGKLEVVDAERGFRRLQQYFPEFRLELLHGRMPSRNREEIMEKFERGEVDLLVSTSVVEVGIDVERASFMVVFNAERFGLAQLHQLRGRVGRGRREGYFFLLSPNPSSRLYFLRDNHDGFLISEYDLKLRGPGNIAGKEQWGIPRFRLLHPFLHQEILKKAQRDAEEYFPSFSQEVSNIIKEEITIG